MAFVLGKSLTAEEVGGQAWKQTRSEAAAQVEDTGNEGQVWERRIEEDCGL